jgi:alkylation response protein AidB-like acyl-CoA dehydrogenase
MPSVVDQQTSQQTFEPPSSFASLKLNGSSATSSNVEYPTFTTDAQSTREYYERAQQVSDLLGLDVHIRDASNEIPFRQVQLLKDSGLVTAIGKEEYGGGGLSPQDAYQLVRIVARGDGSLGQLLAYHYLWR